MSLVGRSGSRRSLRNPLKQSLPLPSERLSIIDEDADTVPPLPRQPGRAQHRPFSRRWNLGDPPRHSDDNSPPEYSVWDVTGPKGEKLIDVRNNKYIVSRGGYKRLCLLALLVVAIVIALGVGLGIGLRKKNESSTTGPLRTDANPHATPSGPFPIGAYSLTTFLDTVSSKCTSQSSTWNCYPYTTYAADPAGAKATFNWIISGSPADLTISSTDNPFAINFANASLKLVDGNTPNERYTFSIPNGKTVIPNGDITGKGLKSACQYNNTVLQASLYTRLSSTYNPDANATSATGTSIAATAVPTSTTGTFQPWPHAVSVEQKINGGTDVPSCYEVQNGKRLDRILNGLDPQPSDSACSCLYKNYGT